MNRTNYCMKWPSAWMLKEEERACNNKNKNEPYNTKTNRLNQRNGHPTPHGNISSQEQNQNRIGNLCALPKLGINVQGLAKREKQKWKHLQTYYKEEWLSRLANE